MTVSFIWFDLGYTLVYQEREAVYRRFLLEQGIELSLNQIERAYHETDKLFMRKYPGALGKELSSFYPWYLGVLNYRLGLSFPLQEQVSRLSQLQDGHAGWRAYPFSLQVLQALKERSLGIGLISNWDGTARTVLKETGLLPYFDHIVISSEVHKEKPDEAIFRMALEEAKLPPQACLYVGDNYYDDVVGSAKVGMSSFLINRFGALGIEELDGVRTIASIQELPHLLDSQTKIIS
ncbi:HAD family hydrolase [Paenibacillus beijingensis]|uniref:Haloacid dehalogenase n=1 Tax=Paenibacillus beijingensis TaxID=1126833 RepID=A0A0D5NKQ1_9BACL|nr:HAD-IA family hydrolase [Paenibacillus beijingensis]AJY75929.1 haloacid dehalogenase [Paenibacillus beijingensis]